jgi:hypothetical protein
MTARSNVVLGDALAALSVGLVVFYVVGWLVFEGGTWALLFGSWIGIGAAIVCGVLVLVFWLWMTREYLRHRAEDGLAWGVLLVMGGQIAALLYFVMVQRYRWSGSECQQSRL